jgi:hypothetical protein
MGDEKKQIINTYQGLLEYIERTKKKDIHIYQSAKIENFEPLFMSHNINSYDCEEEDFWSFFEYINENKCEK